MSRFLFGFIVFIGATAAAAAAEPFAIDLEVRSGKASQTAHAQSAVPDAELPKRPVLEIKAGDRVTVKWKMTTTDPTTKIENVTVHFFAVKEEMAGQKAVPKLTQGVTAESACTLDFGPKERNEAELTFTLEAPGSYLFRVETLGASAVAVDHEDFAAIDVIAH
ncbi:MAG TPA: hypothetical protein VMS17_15960 [Gemmataceae bacterium]|nr:hypothetical protein [Gemmataceae bacterium]